jgi:hypothetical protein
MFNVLVETPEKESKFMDTYFMSLGGKLQCCLNWGIKGEVSLKNHAFTSSEFLSASSTLCGIGILIFKSFYNIQCIS